MTIIDKKLQKLSQNGTVRITASAMNKNGLSLSFYDFKGERYQLGDSNFTRLLKQAEMIAFKNE